ncbi:MAG: hypothetical protein ACT6QT_07900 [Sphingopyxis sp.]|jgi:hypothetical protein|uniref:hypothetical protein n=1 Tax=Alphaproteobacteria TaxID=28211 RepID=UPI003F71E699
MTETFGEFVERVDGFAQLSPTDKICHAAWYLHTIRGDSQITTSSVNACFDEIHSLPPHTAVYLKRMSERKPPLMIKSKSGYRLENSPRRKIEERYGQKRSNLIIPNLLSNLSSKIPSTNERVFLEETLRCYSVSAFRATIVMAWNLAFDHLQNWILSDPSRASAFNTSLSVKYPKKNLTIKNLDDISELKEFETIETCYHAKIISKNVSEILKEKLKRRNAAAHPSGVVITQAQADDVITDLVNNVVLKIA